MFMEKIDIKIFLFEFFEIILGTFIMAASVSFFLLPNELSSGGFSGIATIVYFLFKVPMGITIVILNIPLVVLASFKIGKTFIFKSIIGTASLSIFIDLLNNYQALTSDKFLACIYGGVLTGIGTSLILKANASTGGSDLLSLIIKEYKPMSRTSTLITIIDFIIIIFNVIFLKKVEIGLYSAITIYIMGKVIDIIFEGIYFTKLVFIVTDNSQEIADYIKLKIKRGVTGIYGKGMYTNTKKLVLMCALGRRDLAMLKQNIKKIDPKAFLIITNSREVLGIGFKE